MKALFEEVLEVEEETAPLSSTEFESLLFDTESIERDIRDYTEALSTAAETMTSLEKLIETTASIKTTSEDVVKLSALTLETALANVGQSSLESFEEDVSLEGIVGKAAEAIKKVWKAIKDFFVKLWNNLKRLFTNYGKAYRQLSKYTDDLTQRAHALPADAVTKESVNLSAEQIQPLLGAKNDLLTAGELASRILEMKTWYEESQKLADKYFKPAFKLIKGFRSVNTEKVAHEMLYNDSRKAIMMYSDWKARFSSWRVVQDNNSGTVLEAPGFFVGNKAIYVELKKPVNFFNKDALAGVAVTTNRLGRFDKHLGGDILLFSRDEVISRLKIIGHYVDYYNAAKPEKTIDKVSADIAEAIKIGDAVEEQYRKEGWEVSHAVSLLKTIISGMQACYEPWLSTQALMGSIVKAQINFIEKSIVSMEKATAAKPEATVTEVNAA